MSFQMEPFAAQIHSIEHQTKRGEKKSEIDSNFNRNYYNDPNFGKNLLPSALFNCVF